MAAKPRSEWSPAYRRRIESGERRGLSRAAARGHVSHEAERREKRRRADHAKAVEYAYRLLVSGTTRGRVDRDSIAKGFRDVPIVTPEAQTLTREEFLRRARLSYQELILEFPDFANPGERNPFWYHSSPGY